MITQVSPNTRTTLDGSGNGQVGIGPPAGTRWALDLGTVATSTATKVPTCKLYRGSATGPDLNQLVDSTFTGNAASSAKVGGPVYYSGQWLWAVWTGGDPGAIATLQVFGRQGLRSDPLALSPLGEGFANPVVSQLIIGTPGGPEIVIGVSPLPADLVTYYLTAPLGTNPETVVGATINYDGAGNYAYQGLVIDTSAPKITSLVTGASVAGVVNEASRFALNPGVVLGNARFQQFFEENILLLTSVTGSNTVLAAQATTDTFHRWSLSRNGAVGAGPGNTLTDCLQDRIDVGVWRLANRVDLVSFGALADTVLGCYLDGDANPRRTIRASGEMRGGDGTSSTDTTHYRTAAGVWASDKIVANISGSGETWHGVTFGTGWANSGGSDAPVQYRLMPDGTVQICGIGVSPSTGGYTQVMTTLPSGYRPVHTYGETYSANDGTHLATVDSTGAVTLFMTATSTKFWLNLRFPIDAG